MKKLLLASAVTAASFSVAYGTFNIVTRWESKNDSLTIRGNYGTPLGEEIRRENEREKAFHVFNLLRSAGPGKSLHVNLQDRQGPGLTPAALGREESVRLEGAEEFNPVFSGGILYRMRWKDGLLELLAGDNVIHSSEDAFDFLGVVNGAALVRDKGRLGYVKDSGWVPVDALKGYSVSFARWIGGNSTVSYAERDMDGRRFIIIASIERPSAVLISAPPGEFRDAAVSGNRSTVYALFRARREYSLYRYTAENDDWDLVRTFENGVELLGIRNGRVFWFDPSAGELASHERSVSIPGSRIVDLYPRGRYVFGEEGGDVLYDAEPVKLLMLFYGPDRERTLERMGFSRVDKFEGKTEVWVFPDNYQSSLQALRGDVGHAFFSLDEMRVFYDSQRNGLRKVRSIRVRPTAHAVYVLYVLAALLALLIINELFKKAKGITK